ncbi:hypothetical protein HYDPIDRAFT_32785 [Hydnomerulius pinastri MD-312]|uniref:Uncharacterized protein n=1 Tax=Hydnomerulius pinastri MD-312 TaxID=994086 RepID=A0A0C9W1U9_9AGAM|nr:hypothetical protein HYDPIDRAFT_32785 [Hydnomerulius pinastri MD-312]
MTVSAVSASGFIASSLSFSLTGFLESDPRFLFLAPNEGENTVLILPRMSSEESTYETEAALARFFETRTGGSLMSSKFGLAARYEDSDRTDDDDEGGIVDLSLRADIEPMSSGDEDVEETPAAKRLRLAKIYLKSVKEGLAGDEFDAGKLDKQLISARLRQGVLKHSRKAHLLVADSNDFTTPTSKLRL